MGHLIELVPFASETGFRVSTVVGRNGNILNLDFLIQGAMDSILIPEVSNENRRQDDLWKFTCFEAFLSLGDQLTYWELNVSPSGNWNLYHFDDYRLGQLPEARVSSISHEVVQSTPELHLSRIRLDLSQILPQTSGVVLSLGLTAVIERTDHTKTYWAIEHRGVKPDFHLRGSFSLKI